MASNDWHSKYCKEHDSHIAPLHSIIHYVQDKSKNILANPWNLGCAEMEIMKGKQLFKELGINDFK